MSINEFPDISFDKIDRLDDQFLSDFFMPSITETSDIVNRPSYCFVQTDIEPCNSPEVVLDLIRQPYKVSPTEAELKASVDSDSEAYSNTDSDTETDTDSGYVFVKYYRSADCLDLTTRVLLDS